MLKFHTKRSQMNCCGQVSAGAMEGGGSICGFAHVGGLGGRATVY